MQTCDFKTICETLLTSMCCVMFTYSCTLIGPQPWRHMTRWKTHENMATFLDSTCLRKNNLDILISQVTIINTYRNEHKTLLVETVTPRSLNILDKIVKRECKETDPLPQTTKMAFPHWLTMEETGGWGASQVGLQEKNSRHHEIKLINKLTSHDCSIECREDCQVY